MKRVAGGRCLKIAAAIVFAACLALDGASRASAQALPAASGPGSYVAVGGGVSAFQADYGKRVLGGGMVYADVNPWWRVGLEGEARYLRWHSSEDVTETTYLGGVRVAVFPGRLQPYGKFLAGAGHIVLPFHYAEGTFLTYALGAGLDVSINDRLTLRAVDFEYQVWPQFSFGELKPYGISAGLSFRLNPVSRYPKSAGRSRW